MIEEKRCFFSFPRLLFISSPTHSWGVMFSALQEQTNNYIFFPLSLSVILCNLPDRGEKQKISSLLCVSQKKTTSWK